MHQLTPETSLYEAAGGYVLRTADGEHFAVTLSDSAIDELFDVLVGASTPRSPDVVSVLDALTRGGHVTKDSIRSAGSTNRIAAAVASEQACHRDESVRSARVLAIDDDPCDLPVDASVDLVSYRDGITQIVVPQHVSVTDVMLRRRASTMHRSRLDAHYRPTPDGRRLNSTMHPVTDRAAHTAAAVIVAELERRTAPASARRGYLALVMDLRTSVVTEHPVFPIPAAPQ